MVEYSAAPDEPQTAVVADGITSGDFAADEPEVAARAILNATSRFHDPTHAADWNSPEVEAESG